MARVRIATFNLESLDDRPGAGAPIEDRIAVLRPRLLRLDADVLCLQEVNGQHPARGVPRALLALDRLLEGTPYERFSRAATTAPGGGALDVHNLVVLSRFPVLASRQYRHDLVPPPAWAAITATPSAGQPEPLTWDRPALHAVLDVGAGRKLHVFDLHLRAPLATRIPGQKEGPFAWRSVGAWAEGYFLASMKRAGQALEVRLALDRVFDAERDALVAVCGDYNCVEHEVPFEIIRGGEDQTGNGALATRALVPLESSVPEGRRYSVLHAGQKTMLDHVLVSRPLLAYYRGAEIHNEGLGDEVVAASSVRRSPDSYHAPVVIELELPG